MADDAIDQLEWRTGERGDSSLRSRVSLWSHLAARGELDEDDASTPRSSTSLSLLLLASSWLLNSLWSTWNDPPVEPSGEDGLHESSATLCSSARLERGDDTAEDASLTDWEAEEEAEAEAEAEESRAGEALSDEWETSESTLSRPAVWGRSCSETGHSRGCSDRYDTPADDSAEAADEAEQDDKSDEDEADELLTSAICR